jgi:TP901 family phage tail tape measure protein
MSFEVVGIKLVVDNGAQYFSTVVKADKAVVEFGAANAVAAAKVNVFDDSLKKIKIEGLTNKLNEQKKALSILEQELTQTSAKYGEGSVQAQKKALAVDKLSNAIGITEKQIARENTVLDQERAAFNATTDAVQKTEPAVKQLGNTTEKAGNEAKDSEPKWQGLSEIATGALRHIGEIAVDVFMEAGRAAVGFFKDSIGVAGDFEAGMNRFGAVAGDALADAGLSLKDFRDQFIQIGKELPVSTADVQDAAIEMVKGGIEPATIAAGGLKQVIQFAAAADLDLAEASTIAAKALGGWTDASASAQEKADFLAHSTDLLSKAANASTVDVDELALGLYNVQGTAKSFGVSFDEVVTTLAEVSPAFASSADAGTAFSSFIKSLQPKTKPAIAAMKSLGLYTDEAGSSFYDANGKFVGMQKASELLQQALSGLSDAEKAAIMPQIFGDGLRIASELAIKGSEGFDAMSASMAKQNSVADMAAQKQAGFNTAMDNFKGSVEALQITIGSMLLPVLTDLFTNYLAPGINWVTSFADAFFKMVPAIAASDDPIQTFLNALKVAAPEFLNVISAIEGFKDSVVEFAAPILDVAIPALQEIGAFVSEHLTPILFGLGTAITVGVIPPLLTATAAMIAAAAPIVALIAVSALLYEGWTEDWGGIRTTLTDFWNTTGKPIFDELVAWLGDTIPKAIQVVSDFWTDTLWPALQKVWSFISVNIIPIIGVLVGTTFKVLGTALTTLATLWTDTLWPALQKVWAFFDDHIIPIIGALVNIWWALMKKELQLLADLWTNVFYPALDKVWQFIDKNIIPIFDSAGKGATVLGGIIRDTLGPAFTWLQDNVLKPVNEWLGTIGDTIDNLTGWLNDLADTINNLPGLPSEYEGHSPPPIAQWMTAIGEEALGASLSIGEIASAVANLPSSLPGWLSGGSLGDLFDSSGAWGNSGGGGGSSGGGGWGLTRGIASASLAGLRGGASSVTNNQQRSLALTYNTASAPPVSQSYAMAQALIGGF